MKQTKQGRWVAALLLAMSAWSAHSQLLAVQVAHGDLLHLTFNRPVPARTPFGTHGLSLPTWSVTGGELLLVSETELVYQAPKESGLYLLLWEQGDQRAEVLIHVPTALECTEIVTPIVIEDHYVVPVMNAAPFRIYFQGGSQIPRGPSICLVRGHPISGKRLTGECEGNGRTNERYKSYSQSYIIEMGEVTVTSELAGHLAAIGIRVSVGVRIKIQQYVERTTKMRLEDCYRCVNGQLKLVGSRVEYQICDQITYRSPTWACQASHLLMLPGCGLQRFSGCRFIGDCECPRGPVITGCD